MHHPRQYAHRTWGDCWAGPRRHFAGRARVRDYRETRWSTHGHGAGVGGQRTAESLRYGAAVSLGSLDLAAATVDVMVNGIAQERASGAEVLGTPVASIAWLANTLAQFDRRLESGMQVMSGSFTKQYDINRGDVIEARFEPIGAVSARFG